MVGFEGPFQKISALPDEPLFIPIKAGHLLRTLIQNQVFFLIIFKLNKTQRINEIYKHIRLTLVITYSECFFVAAVI
jgi:hypothetical protein